MKHHVFRLHRGADLLKSIADYAKARQIKAGYIACCVGCLSHARVRDAGGVTLRDLEGPLEIVGATGTVSAARCHIHIVFSREDLSAAGGHLTEGCIVNTTAEVVLCEIDGYAFTGLPDAETGYLELSAAAVPDESP